MVLSLQGCMAVGKTTAARYLQHHTPQVQVFFESTGDVIQQVRSRQLDKKQYPDYLEIQKLWLANEVRRWEQAVQYPCSVLDFGAEEIEFYTLHYPQSIGQNWEVERPLHKELAAVRRCMPDRILFLDASDTVLRARKEADATRSREFLTTTSPICCPLNRLGSPRKTTWTGCRWTHSRRSRLAAAYRIGAWTASAGQNDPPCPMQFCYPRIRSDAGIFSALIPH